MDKLNCAMAFFQGDEDKVGPLLCLKGGGGVARGDLNQLGGVTGGVERW